MRCWRTSSTASRCRAQHGFPLRLVIAGWYGMAHVKWLGAITALTEPFRGFQQAVGYRLYDSDGDAGAPVTRMLPRSLTIPPGDPGVHDARAVPRRRALPARGPRVVGLGAVERVEVSVDGGATWDDAQLGAPLGERAWRGWSYAWDAPAPGSYVISSRATDAAGNTQPVEPPWNLKGYANNEIERVPVTVRTGA